MDNSEHLRQNPGFRINRKKTSSFLRINQTAAERLLWNKLKAKQIKGLRFRRQHPLLNYIVDFYCASKKLVIEVDGSIHNYKHEADLERQNHLESMGYTVIRFTNDLVVSDIQSVLEKIIRVVQN